MTSDPGKSASVIAAIRARVSRGPPIESGRPRLAPSIASISMNGTPPQWSPCRCVNKIVSMLSCSIPCWLSAISDDVPKSRVNRVPPPSTRMQVWNRPPLPNESPEPTKRTVIGIGLDDPSLAQPVALRGAEPQPPLEDIVRELAARRLEHTGDVSALELLHHPCLRVAERQRQIHLRPLTVAREEPLDVGERVFLRDDDRALDDVLQLAHVPRPRVAAEGLHGIGGNRPDALLAAAGAPLEE